MPTHSARVTSGETPEERRRRLARERQARFRQRRKQIDSALRAAAKGDTETVETLQASGVPVYVQRDIDAARQEGHDTGYVQGMRAGFAGGRMLERLLDGFLRDEWPDDDGQTIRDRLRQHPQVEAVVRAEVVSAGVPREQYLLWLGRI